MLRRSKGIVISYLKIATNMICGVILSSVLLRILGDTEYGIYQTVAAFANNLVLLEFGVGTVMIRNISMCRERQNEDEIQRNISTIWTLTWLLSLLLLVASALFYYMIPKIYSKSLSGEQIRHAQHIFVLISGYLLLNFLIHTINAVIFSFEDYLYGSLQSISRILVRTVLLVVLLVWYKNAIVIALVDLVLSAVCITISWLYCRRKLNVKLRFGEFDPGILRSSIPLALAIFLQGVVSQANSNVDKVIIGVMMTPEMVTLYSVALYIYSIFTSLSNVAASMYVPTVTQYVGQGRKEKELAKCLIAPSRLTAIIGGMVLLGFISVGGPFVEILYGSDYLVAWPLAVILMIPAYIDAVAGTVVYVLDAMNKRMTRSVVLLLSTTINIILTVIFLPQWGVFGAAIAAAVCTLVGPVLFMNLYYQKSLKIPILWLFRQAFRGILVYLMFGCGVAFGISNLFDNVYASFLIGGIAFVVISLGGYCMFGMNEEEKRSIKKLLNRNT